MRRVLIVLMIISFAGLNPFSPAEAGSITVDGACTLIDAIIAANTDTPTGNCPAGSGPDTITLDVDVSLTAEYLPSSVLFGARAGLPDIASDITIQAGAGTTISGNDTTFRIFNVAGGSLTLDGITVSGGHVVGNNASVGGGAFYVASGRTLTLMNSSILNNTAEHTNGTTNGHGVSGGAVYSQGTVILQNTTVNDNVAQGGDGIYGGFASGGAIYNLGNMSITDSQLSNNQALGGLGTTGSRPAVGGAIANLGTIDTIANTTLQNNSVHGYGTNGITGYEAASGGALYNTSNVISISGSTFSANTAMVTTSGENAAGGAIFNRLQFGSVTNSTFSGNSTQKTSGNLIAGGAFYTTSGMPSFNHVTFLNNASGSGEDIYLSGPTTVTVNNSILAGVNAGVNCAHISGILTGANNLTDDASCNSISAGSITLDTHIESTLASNGGRTQTHALIDTPGNPAVDASPACGLATDQRGEARDANCDIGSFELLPVVETPTPTDTLVSSTDTPSVTATNTGLPPSDTPTETWTPSITPTPEPQDIVVDGFCTLIDAINAANTDAPVGSCPAGNGADTIYLDVNTQLTQAYSPSAMIYGGHAGLPDITSNITIEARLGYLISGNSSDFRIFNISSVANLTLVGVTVENGRVLTSTSEGRGGGLLNFGTLTLVNTTITGNSVESVDSSGGGIYNSNTLTIDLSDFSGNFVQTGDSDVGGGPALGGAVANNGTMSVTDTTFHNNQARGGDGPAGGNAYGAGLYLMNGSDTIISSSTFSQNISLGGSASSQVDTGHAHGGAVYADTTSSLSISNSTIHGNQASGGIHAGSTGYGGGVFSHSVSAIIDHITLINNLSSTAGDALFSTDLTFQVNHSIIASSGGKNDCQGVTTGTGNLTVDVSCSAVSGGLIIPGTHVNTALANNGGPTMTNALLPVNNNPAIDGNLTCPYTYDQRGVPRVGGCDIGAYELDTSSPTPTPTQTLGLSATALCFHPDVVVTVWNGDGPFEISASEGINVPVTVSIGPTTINGPEKWDNLTVTELSGDLESINLGKFKCRPLEIPQPLAPAHRSRTTNPSPVFSWTAITGANRYRVFVFDDRTAANRTVDMRQNSIGDATMLVFDTPLPVGRLFWRVRGRVNRVWGYWSIRYTLFIDPAPVQATQTPVPALVPVPTGIVPPNSR